MLCTANETYELQSAETSNTLMLFNPEAERKPAADVEGDAVVEMLPIETSKLQSHYELRLTAPRLVQLRRLLERAPFGGSDEDEEEDGGAAEARLYSLDTLENIVQASRGEIMAELGAMEAVQVGEHWRVLDRDYLWTVIDVLLLTVVEQDWDINALEEDAVVAAMSDFPAVIARHVLRTHCMPAEEGAPLVLNRTRVTTFRAEQLLAAAKSGSTWKVDEFMDMWRKVLPETFDAVLDAPELSMLGGLAIVKKFGPFQHVVPFHYRSLSDDPAERFKQLFAQQARWTLSELQPYIRTLAMPNMTQEEMILAHCKEITFSVDPDEKREDRVFCSRLVQ